jgi:hypothetical protein
MAIDYYDWGKSYSDWNVSTVDFNWYKMSACSSSTIYTFYPARRFMIEQPESWTNNDAIAFMHLINDETKTGYIVEMIITGDILITDPNIEHRTMKQFIPLLRRSAIKDDRDKINSFFVEHPIESAKSNS